MPAKLFVGRLANGTRRDELKSLFEKYGKVTECDVISNFAFVHMDSVDEADSAIKALDGYTLKGSNIHVQLSRNRPQGRRMNFNSRSFGSQGRSHQSDPYPTSLSYQSTSDYLASSRLGQSNAQQRREEYATEQVKDLLELYFRDPMAFDEYAKTYYYGERMERLAHAHASTLAASKVALPNTSYFPPPRRY